MITIAQVLERFQQNRVSKLVLLLSLIFGGFLIKAHLERKDNTSIRLGYSFFGSINEIDPIEIQSIYQSNIIENLFSRLIEHDNAGQIVCSLCSSFYIDKNTIYFQFDNHSSTIDGHLIGAPDAKVSLERIATSQTNTHGSLRYYLDNSSRHPIEVNNGQLSIKVSRSEWVPFVLSLLTSMDFSIIPQGSLDPTTNKIIDYRNTSGYYYVSSSDDHGHLRLSINSNHANYQDRMIDEIQFVPIKSGEAQTAFANDSIDIIDPTYYAYSTDVEKILNAVPNANVHKTVQIGLTSLVFSKTAMSKSTNMARLTAAIAIKKWFFERTDKIFGAQETDQYFQSFGQGFITSEQKKFLHEMSTQAKNSSHKFVLGLTEKYRQWAESYQFPNFIEVRFYKSYPGFLPDKERPDIYLVTADSSFDEDISSLSYLFSQGIFAHGKDDGALWIQEYMNLSTREQRIERLRDLHFEVLKSVKVYPLISRPYVAIARPSFEMNFPKIYAGSPMWKVWKR